ncbi:hypothetical protein IPG36_04880 [bacterium]|nr:MAG: hypothetical protein IPG36_04880 [bacterium]
MVYIVALAIADGHYSPRSAISGSGTGLSAEVLRDTRLGLVMFGMNVVFYGLARRWRHSMRQAAILAAVILFFDILIITFFIYTKGGIESRSIFLLFYSDYYGRRLIRSQCGLCDSIDSHGVL